MRGKWLNTALLAAVGVLAWGGTSRGGDIIRLNGVKNAPARNLVDDGQGADTTRVWHRGFGWGYGGLGWGGWGYRGFGWGGWGYRGLGWGGFYRPYYGFGLGYGGLGYGLGLGGLGFARFGFGGFYPGFGFGYGGFFGPWCAGVSANVYTLNMPARTLGSPLPGAPQAQAPDAAPRDDGTFPYDGGPSKAVPSPKDAPPSSAPPRSVPLEGRAVSLPKAAPKWIYPAYGERARRTTPASERTYLTHGEKK
jgi:hypothetical protein